MGRMKWAGATAAVLGIIWAATASAADVKVGALVLEAPWTRATPGGAKVGSGYLAVINSGDAADRLIDASSPVSELMEIHEMSMTDGVMRMRRMDPGLELKPQSVTELKPGGYHLMFIGLKQAIKEGDQVAVELTFETAGKVQLVFEAAAIGATVAPGQPAAVGGGSGAHAGSHSGQAPHGSASGQPAQGSHSGQAPHGSASGQPAQGSHSGQAPQGSTSGQPAQGSHSGQAPHGSASGQPAQGSHSGQAPQGSTSGQPKGSSSGAATANPKGSH